VLEIVINVIPFLIVPDGRQRLQCILLPKQKLVASCLEITRGMQTLQAFLRCRCRIGHLEVQKKKKNTRYLNFISRGLFSSFVLCSSHKRHKEITKKKLVVPRELPMGILAGLR
jgi:hypothetical protein